MEPLDAAIMSVVNGDVAQLPTILAFRHSELLEAAGKFPQLLVSRSALTRVLVEWRDGRCTSAEVHQWASFIRRGYISENVIEPARPIDIEYDIGDEDLIVAIIARLDEIGDSIDGYVGAVEREAMLKSLRQ